MLSKVNRVKYQDNEQVKTIVTDFILNKITECDKEASIKSFQLLKISLLSPEAAEELINKLLERTYEAVNTHIACPTKNETLKEITREIIDKFDDERSSRDPLPALTYLFLNSLLDPDILLFVLECFPEKEPFDLLQPLVNMSDDDDAVWVASKIATYYPTIPNEDWKLLVTLTDDVEDETYRNKLLRKFFINKDIETRPCLACPSWIRTDLKQGIIDQIPKDFPTVKDAVDILMNNMPNNNISISERERELIKETVISNYAISTIVEKVQMLSEFTQVPTCDDISIFQEYGPVNSIYMHGEDTLNHSHKCRKYGGCRMFLCTEFEEIDDEGEEIDIMASGQYVKVQWFRGSCDKCTRKIKFEHYALRQPLRHGGWRGCFCSFECLAECATDPILALLIGRIKEQITVIGITAR